MVRWRDRHSLGVDVFAHSFPRERSYAILREKRARVLLLRMEDLDRTLGPALSKFQDLPKEPATVRPNVRDRTGDAAECARVLERFRLPREIVDEIYARRVVRHFYSEEMIAGFARRWTAV